MRERNRRTVRDTTNALDERAPITVMEAIKPKMQRMTALLRACSLMRHLLEM